MGDLKTTLQRQLQLQEHLLPILTTPTGRINLRTITVRISYMMQSEIQRHTVVQLLPGTEDFLHLMKKVLTVLSTHTMKTD